MNANLKDKVIFITGASRGIGREIALRAASDGAKIEIEMKRFDLIFAVNVRATFMCSKLCIPHLKLAKNPHILTLSPPLNMNPKWFKKHVAYTMSKYGMSMCTLGMAEEFKKDGIAV